MLKHNCEHYVGTACPMCAKEDSELIAKLQSQLRVAVEALEQVVKHEQDSLKYDSEIHKFNRYRENMYFKCLEALQKIEAMKGN